MRGGIVIVLLGLTAFGAYYIGRQDMRTANTPSVIVVQAPGPVSKPLALTTAPSNVLPTQLSKTIPPGPSDGSAPPPKPQKIPAPQQGDTKRRVEVVLTAAAIAAILVKRAGTSITRQAGHALARMTLCGTAGRAAGKVPTRGRAAQRHCAIRLTSLLRWSRLIERRRRHSGESVHCARARHRRHPRLEMCFKTGPSQMI